MKTLRSLGPIAGIIALLVLTNVASRVAQFLPVLLIGLGLLGGSVWVWWRTRTFLETAWNADGTIVGTKLGRGRTRNSRFPVVRFATVTGEEIEFVGGYGTSFGAYLVGTQVGVRYDPHKPEKARIESWTQLWFLPALLGLLGVVFTVVGIVLMIAQS